MRFLKNAKGSPSERNTGVLSAEELKEAKVLWIKRTQLGDFRDELVHLKGCEVLPKKNGLNNLSPYLDSETGSIRVGGRIHKSSLLEGTKYPVILPHQNRFVNFIIQEAHEKQLHAGTNQNSHAYK